MRVTSATITIKTRKIRAEHDTKYRNNYGSLINLKNLYRVYRSRLAILSQHDVKHPSDSTVCENEKNDQDPPIALTFKKVLQN